MSPASVITLLIIILSIAPYAAYSRTDSLLLHADLPFTNNTGDIALDVLISSKINFNGRLDVLFYKYSNTDDSSCLLRKKAKVSVTTANQIKAVKLKFNDADSGTFCDPAFSAVIQKTELMPPGDYKIFISLADTDTIFHYSYQYHTDSILSPNSRLRKQIDKSLLAKQHSLLGLRLNNPVHGSKAKAGVAVLHARAKTERAMRRLGITTHYLQRNDKSYIDLYYRQWFAGRYEVKNQTSLSSQVNVAAGQARSTNYMSLSSSDLGTPSLLSQFKTFNKQQRGKDEIKGQISLNTVAGNEQEENSGMSNNYYEVRGSVGMPVLGIPFELEGLYTSQDNGRKIKSSYFRVHYDVTQVKSDLLKYISSYNSKFAECASKQRATEMIYSSALSRWKEQRNRLQEDLDPGQVSSENIVNATDTETDTIDMGAHQQDTTQKIKREKSFAMAMKKAAKAKKDIAKDEKSIKDKEEELKRLNEKIEKYEALLSQSKNTNYFDSAMGYARTKEMSYSSDLSYKQMAKKCAGILPDGEGKKIISGLTSFDAGIFSKTESKYTMAGQQIKGADVGYDIGFAELGATVGKTEYIGRDGTLDKYTCYSTRASMTPIEDQKISLVYYSYSPDRKLYQGEGFFSNINISTPTFFQPVHIAAVSYTGSINKIIDVNSEVAASFKRSEMSNSPKTPMSDKMAYHVDAEANIPKTPVAVAASFDKTGRAFENSTMPLSLKGIEQYKIQTRSDIFRAVITAGVEYNYVIQNNLSSKGSNTKWGFDVKTNFKRYPNVALSYKPFTSFHSYTDTLSVPQRPLIGQVWTGKATYQLRKSGRTLRLLLLYTGNETTMDTTAYSNKLLQGTCIYNDKKINGTLTVGTMYQHSSGTVSSQTPDGNTRFINITAGYAINKKINVSGGQDVGFNSFGVCRYATNASVLHQSLKAQFMIRICARFNTYRLTAGEQWKEVISGNMEITYRFKGKLK